MGEVGDYQLNKLLNYSKGGRGEGGVLRVDMGEREGIGGGCPPMLQVRNSSQKLTEVQHWSNVMSGICST